MNVGDLKKALANIPDDVLVVTPANDHSYLAADGAAGKAVRESRSRLSEYHGPEYVEKGMAVIDVFVVGGG